MVLFFLFLIILLLLDFDKIQLNLIYVILWDIKTKKDDPINDPIKKHDESYFTDEDFIYAKVGEWISRP